MTKPHFVALLGTVLLLTAPAPSQSPTPADLLQKGIHQQETVGDVDSAIQIFRQVAASPAANKTLAAQAQYQLVVCMIQKGDRGGARRELDLLARNFPSEPDLLAKGRKLIPGGDTFVPAPWGPSEGSQLNIKRDGVFTGEYLHYSVDPSLPGDLRPDNPQAVVLRWELNTVHSKRSVQIWVDPDTFQPLGKPRFSSDDTLGDPSAGVLAGPAIDVEQSVFRMRRMPLAVGFKSTLNSEPFMLASRVRGPIDLVVTGIESIQTLAGKFNCYKVSMPAIHQTFWIGVEGARPLVKIQSGNLEAELVKVWTTNPMDSVLDFAVKTGWYSHPESNSFFSRRTAGPEREATLQNPDNQSQNVTMLVRKQHTPKAEIAQALQKSMVDRPLNWTNAANERVIPESVETLQLGGHQALRCLVEAKDSKGDVRIVYFIWIRSESTAVRLVGTTESKYDFPVFRWQFDRALATIQVP